MVRDPWWVFAYWEIRPDDEARLRARIGAAAWDGGQSILRVYDVTGAAPDDLPAQGAQDIVLRDWANNWYIHVGRPNREWLVAVGRLTAEGVFHPLVCSNRVTTPRSGPSDVIDENWLSLEEDYWKLFGVAGGCGIGKSSLEVQQWWARQHVGGVSSGALFSAVSSEFAAPQPRERQFWLWMNAELILYGATMPDAQVRIQGQAVALRPDGSFTVRYALPDGQQHIPVEAIAPDHGEMRTITCTVTRATHTATPQQLRTPTATR